MKEFGFQNRKMYGNMRKEFDIIMDGMTPSIKEKIENLSRLLQKQEPTWWMETMWGIKMIS